MKPTAAYAIAAVILVVGLMYLALRDVLHLNIEESCITDKVKVQDLAGFRFEIEYTNCDTIAKEESIDVYGSKVASKYIRTLLFSYDPGRYDAPLPSVTLPSISKILISIPDVSSIRYQNRKWENMSIEFDIGHVYYPQPSK